MLSRLRAAAIACAVVALATAAATPAQARHRHHRLHRPSPVVQSFDLTKINTKAGAVTVARDAAAKFEGFIRDVVARGFQGPVHCYSATGHVRHSLHHSGRACDFAQRGWGKTVRPMYHVADLAAKWGLRDGCGFRDCGHIDTGRPAHRRYATSQ